LILSNKEFCLACLYKPGIKEIWKIFPTYENARLKAYSPALHLEKLLRIFGVDSPNRFFSLQDVNLIKNFVRQLQEEIV